MKDRKITAALIQLSVYELNSFNKYVNSPYFNVNESISKYLELILDWIKKGNTNDDVPNEELWNKVYGDIPYQNQKFLKLNSDLVKLLEDFLAQQEYDHMLSLRTNLKLEGVRKRGIEKLYNGIIGELERLEKMEVNQSVEYYYTKYQIERGLFNLKTENEKKNAKFEIETELNINKISENLDYFYIAEKLRLYCTLLSWKKMYQLDIDMDNMDWVLTSAKQNKMEGIPPIQIYDKMQNTYVDGDNTLNYFELRQMMKKHIHLFPQEELKEIYATAISYCINRVNKGDESFQRENFDLYKETIEKDIIILNSDISPTTFRNIVHIALRVGEFDWAENFIFEYSKYIDEKYRANAVEFSLARLEFYRKDFNKVLDHLNKVTYEDVWYNLGSKSLLIFTYYELDETDALESLLQAFKMYIRREKSLTIDRKDTYLNLIKFTLNLMKLTYKDKDKLTKLKTEITNTKGVVSKPWLLEKIDILLNKK
ncbi:MAG TPA: hypothetical protein VK169_14845 [Saprospiraceae bacterium]|nr:hypothetical protein [Saprospiraceae bacterium]